MLVPCPQLEIEPVPVPDAVATDAAQREPRDTNSPPHEDLNLRSQATPYSHWMAGQKIRTLEGISRQILCALTDSSLRAATRLPKSEIAPVMIVCGTFLQELTDESTRRQCCRWGADQA